MRIGTMIEPKKVARAFLTDDPDHSLANEARRLIDAGANHIEISGEAIAALPGPLRHKFPEEASGGLRELHEKDGVTFSVHLPFLGGVNFTTSVDAIRHASVDVVKEIVSHCEPVDPVTYVLHVSGLLEDLMGVGLRDDAVVEAYLAYAVESVAEIIKSIPPEKLCIENLEYISFEKIMPIVEQFDTSICMDVGHVKLRNEDVSDFVKRYASRLGHVHMHDVTWRMYDKRVRVMDDHQELGVGIVDVESIVRMLSTAGFSGPVVLEIHTVDPIDSVRILRNAVDKVEN